MKFGPLLVCLVAGTTLGAAGGWLLRDKNHAFTTATALQTERTTQGGAPRLQQPDRLAPVEADAAIDVWVAQPPLTAETPPAEILARRIRLRALLTRLPDDRLEPLLNQLVARTGDAERGLFWLIFDVWTERDAPAAARWALTQTEHPSLRRYLSQAALEWARTDFAAAYAWSTSLKNLPLADHVTRDLLNRLAATDPQRATELARERGKEFYESAGPMLYFVWIKQDPAAALANLEALSPRSNKLDWPYREAITHWLAKSPEAAFDWVNARGARLDEYGRTLLDTVISQVSGNNLAARNLADLIAARPDLPEQTTKLASLLGSWQSRDPQQALAWLDTIKDPSVRGDLADRVTREWWLSDAKVALEFKLRLPDGVQRDKDVTEAVAKWARASPDDALAWLQNHPDQADAKAAEAVQGVLLGHLAKTDLPAALKQWEQMPAGPGKAAAQSTIATAWAGTAPEAAARWLVALPTSSASNPVDDMSPLRTAVQNWAAQDPAATLRWITSITDAQKRKQAQSAFMFYNDYERDSPEPAARANLLMTVEDRKQRDDMLRAHAMQWLRRDYQAARSWLESTDAFSAEETARLLDNNDPYRPR